MQRNQVDPHVPFAVIRESEPDVFGNVADCVTVFLTASECPIGCSMCDLWQNTLTGPTPVGAVPKQIDHAIGGRLQPGKIPPDKIQPDQLNYIKLYNSGNFFDARSIPPSDYAAIADRCQPFDRVIVENHPAIGMTRMIEFNDRLDSQLEVAVGLETVQPRWLDRMGKRMTRDSFDDYCRLLIDHRIDVRVFLIVGVPSSSATEAIRWARLSVRHAVLCGARHISLIPARAGHGWNGAADQLPIISRKQLADLHQDATEDAKGFATVTVDTWGLDPT